MENNMDPNFIEFIMPLKHQFTVYSKSDCPYCADIKSLLKDKNIVFTIIDCDDYLKNFRMEFLQFIRELTNKDWRTFPMIFDNQYFIGGFNDTKEYLEKILYFDQDF